MKHEEWSKTDLKKWANFWNSEMGKITIAKMETLKQRNLEAAMFAPLDHQVGHLNKAAGIDIVIKDIQRGIELAKEEDNQKSS